MSGADVIGAGAVVGVDMMLGVRRAYVRDQLLGGLE